MKVNKKNNMLQLNDHVKQMFEDKKYHDIIEEFTDLDEIHELVSELKTQLLNY